MKEKGRDFWKKLWDEKALSDDMFVQAGRSSYTLTDFFLMIKDIDKTLKLERDDVVLDAGGGAGSISMCISPFVKEITLFDYTEKLINRAKLVEEKFRNINVNCDNILSMEKIKNKRHDKVIVGSVLQYLENYEQVETSLGNINSVMSSKGIALFAHNPDFKKKKEHINSYCRLDWDRKKIKQSLEWEEKRLWLDMEKVNKIASCIGFSRCYEVFINPELFESTYMFSFVVEK